MKLQHQMANTFAHCKPWVSLSQNRRVHQCLKVSISILLFPSLSLIGTVPLRAVPFPSISMKQGFVQTNPAPLNTQIQDAVQAELDLAYRRTFAALNLLLIVLILLPTASAVVAWLLLSRLGDKIAIAQQEIESLQGDAVSELERLIEETKTALHDLLEKNTLAEETLKKLNLQSDAAQSINSSYSTRQNIELARDYAKQGEKFFIEGCYQEAINAYSQALELQPTLAEVWNNRGVILTKLQRYSEAIASYEQALKFRSDYPDALNNRGVALGKLKYYEAAVASYDRAVEFKPDYGDAWNNRGFALTKLEKYDEAIQSYQKAADFKPEFYLIWYNQARCYGLQGKTDLAIESLKKAIDIKPEVSRKLAKTESDFELLRQDQGFQALVTG